MSQKLRAGILLLVFGLMLAACGIRANLDDGYQVGDVADGLVEDKRMYCSAPYRGIRAVGRMIISFLGGVTVPDPCRLIDAIVQDDGAPAAGGADPQAETEKVLPGTP